MYSCWEIPWTEEPGRLQSLGSQSQRVGHDFVTEHANVHTFKLIYCNLVVQLVQNAPANTEDSDLIPRLGRSPGEGNGNPLQYSCLGNPNGQRSLVGYSLWGHKESDPTEQLTPIFNCNFQESLLRKVRQKHEKQFYYSPIY